MITYDYESLIRIGEWLTHSFVDSPPAAWPVEVFKFKHRSKHRGKGGVDKHQLQPQPHRQARPSLLPSMHPPQHRRKHRGKHGGIKHRLQSRPHGSSLSSILLPNVQALDNKLDNLHACISFQWDIRNFNVLCYTLLTRYTFK